MRLRKLLKFLGSALMILVLLNSCEELLGVNGDGDGEGVEATNQQAKQYTTLVIHSIGLLFDGFDQEASFNKQTEDGSVAIVGTYSEQSKAIDFTVTLTNFTDGESNVRVTTPSGNPITVSGTLDEEQDTGSLDISGTAQLSNTDFTAVTLDINITWDNNGPTIDGTVWVDDKSFEAETLGIELGDGGDGGDDLSIEDAVEISMMTLSPMGDLFDNFDTIGENESFNFDNISGSTTTSGAFSATISYSDYNVNEEGDTPVYLNGSISITGVINDSEMYADFDGTVNITDGPISTIDIDYMITIYSENSAELNGTVTIDNEVFTLTEFMVEMGGGGYPIDEFVGVWELVTVSEFDYDDNMWYDDDFPMDMAYEFTYDHDNDTPGDSDIDGDGTADTYEMGQYIEITMDEELIIYLDMLFNNTDGSVSVTDLQNNDMPVVETGLYYLSDVVDDIYLDEDGYVYSSLHHIDGMNIALSEDGNTMTLSGEDVEVTLVRVSDTVLDGAIALTEMDSPEYEIIEMFKNGGDDGGPEEFSMMLLKPVGEVFENFESFGDNESFAYDNISGSTGTNGSFSATISYSDYEIFEGESTTVSGSITVTGVLNDVDSYADFAGVINMTDGPIDTIEIDYTITFSEDFGQIDGTITIDGQEIIIEEYIFEMGDDYGHMPYPVDGTAEELAAYYPLAAVADIGSVFEPAENGTDPYENGSITGEGWEISGTYTDSQSFTYTIVLTSYTPDPDSDMELTGTTTGEATLDVNGDGTATLVSTGDLAIAGNVAQNSTVSFDLSLTIIGWKPDGTVTGSVTLDGTTYDASTELTFDFGMDVEEM